MTAMMNHKHTTKRFSQRCTIRLPRILCIDDDPDIQTTIELRMRNYAVEIEHAFYGMQGIVETLKTHPDLILMDLAMPNGDGRYLLQCIRKNSSTAHIPVIVLTGMRDPSLKGRLLHEGANAFLQKPVRFEDLLEVIEEYVRLRPAETEGESQ